MAWTPNTVNARQWALDAEEHAEPYESELVAGLPALRALNPYGSLRAARGPRCYELDGVDDRIHLPTFTLAGTIRTFCMRVNSTDSVASKYLWDSMNGGVLAWVGNSANILAYHDGVAWHQFGSASTPNDGLWHSLVWVIDHTTVTLYIDGVALPTVLTVAPIDLVDTASSDIFAANNGVSFHLAGLLRDFRIYPLAFTAEQAMDYHNGVTIAAVKALSLNCTEEAANGSLDSSGQKNHGLILNAALADLHAVEDSITENPANSAGYTLGRQIQLWTEQMENWNGGTFGSGKTITHPSTNQSSRNYAPIGGDEIIGQTYHLQATVVSDKDVDIAPYAYLNPDFLFPLDRVPLQAGVPYVFDLTAAATSGGGYGGTMLLGWTLYDYLNGSSDWPVTVTIDGQQLEKGSVGTTYQKSEASTLLDVIIPRDESAPTKDALGNDLQYPGQCPFSITTETPVGSFDGLASRIEIPFSPDFEITQRISMVVRFKTVSVAAAFGRLFGRSYPPNQNAYYLQTEVTEPGQVSFFATGCTPAIALTTRTDLNDGQEHTVVLTYDGAQAILYVDGVQDSVTPMTGLLLSDNTRGLGIGGFVSQTTQQFFNGEIAEVRLYDDVLTPSEVSGQDDPGEDNLIVDYPICEGAGPKVHSVVENANSGLVTSATLANFWAIRSGAAKDHGVRFGGRNNATFDGVDDYVDCGDGGTVTGSDLTVEATITPSNTAAVQRGVVSHMSGLASGQYGLWQNGTAVRWLVDLDTGLVAIGNTPGVLTAGETYRLRGTYDGSFVRLFVNDVEVDSTPATGSIDPAIIDLQIGQFDAANRFAGRISDVSIAGVSLLSAYPLDDNQGSLIRDTSGNDNHGLLVNPNDSQFWQFVPGLRDGSGAADGQPLTLTRGHFCNNASRLIYDPWDAPELAQLLLPAESPVGELLRNAPPIDQKYRSEMVGASYFFGRYDYLQQQAAMVSDPAFAVAEFSIVVRMRRLSATFANAYEVMLGRFYNHVTLDGRLRYEDSGGWILGATILRDNVGEWFDAVFTTDGNDSRLYFNGVEDGQSSDPRAVHPSSFGIGGLAGFPQTINGDIDRIRFYDRKLTPAEVQFLHDGSGDDPGVANRLADWRYEDRSGQTVSDSSGNGYDAELNFAAGREFWIVYDDGQPFADGDNHVFNVPAIQDMLTIWTGTFDGVDDEVTTTAQITSAAGTLAVWARADANVASMRLIGDLNKIRIEQDSGLRTRIRYDDGTGIKLIPMSGLFTLGQWHHFAVTWDGTTVKGYRDGVLAASELWGPLDSPGTMTLSTAGTIPFDGPMSESHVYSAALTADQVAWLARKPGYDPGAEFLVSHHDFIDQVGTALTDISGNGNDGTLSGDDGSNFWTGQVTAPISDPHGLVGGDMENARKYIERRSRAAAQFLINPF